MRKVFLRGLIAIGLSVGLIQPAGAVWLDVRTRDAGGEALQQTVDFDPTKTAVVVIDMWDSHYDDVFLSRAPNVIPRMNQTMEVCRDLGMQVVWAPAGCIPYYENPANEGYAQRQAMTAIPYHAMPSPKQFNPPAAPYYAKSQNMTPPGVTNIPVWPAKTKQDGDLTIAANDLIVDADNAQELWNLVADRNIEQLIFAGHATNWCLTTRAVGMINMNRYMDTKLIFIRDLTEAFSCNGYNWETQQIDWSTSPDTGTAESVQHNELYLGGSIHAGQLLQEDSDYSYSSRVSYEQNLLTYWRMDCNDGYKTLRDYRGTQGLWNVQAVTLGVPGVTADGDTAAWFDGSSGMIGSPRYRTELPTGSPLESLSADSFSVEAWVQIGQDALGSRRWIVTHDEDNTHVDFLLGLNNDGRFRFDTRDLASNAFSTTTVTQADIDAQRWFHLVAVQDAEAGTVNLYVDGQLEGSTPLVGTARATPASLQVGSRGTTSINPDGGAVTSSGSEFFKGAIDEVAIYNGALSLETIQSHYLQELWVPPELPPPPEPLHQSRWNLNAAVSGKTPVEVGPQDGVINGNTVLATDGPPAVIIPDGVWVKPDNHFFFGGQAGDNIDLGNDASLSPAEITVGFWAKSTGDHTGTVMLGKHSTTGSSYELAFGNNGNAFFRSFVGGSQAFAGNDAADPFSATEFQDDQWHYFVGAHDGAQTALYVDGMLVEALSNPGQLNDTTGATKLLVGQRAYPGAEAVYNGKIGGPLFVLDYALSAEEIMNLLASNWIPGDANGDGIVDVSDLGILATNYDQGGGFGWEQADFTGDGVVDVSDLGVLATNYGTTSSGVTVPEPGIIAMMMAGALCLLLRQKR